jgi:hypothetical protein
MSEEQWATFAASIAQFASVDVERLAPEGLVLEPGLLDSLALAELCVLAFEESGVDLLDDAGNFRSPKLTWGELFELLSTETAYLSHP